MKIKIRLIIGIVLFIVGVHSFFLIKNICERKRMVNLFESLEAHLLPFDVLNEGGEIFNYQHIAYVLKAEVKMYNAGNHDKASVINYLAKYLMIHSDDNDDGEPGWGLGEEWDAFSDGSINPENHVYAIQVANVIDALLDAIDSGGLDTETKYDLLLMMHDVAVLWNTKYWTEENETGRCFYWYSISSCDEIECVNISAKMAGTFSRLLFVSENFNDEERSVIGDRIDKTISRVYELAYKDDNAVIWNYLSAPNSSYNDIIHHAFILEGINDYTNYRGNVGAEYQCGELTQYIYNCIDLENMQIYSYPDYSFERAFDTGALPLIEDDKLRRKLLINAYEKYFINEQTEDLQLTFLLYAMADYINDITYMREK